MKIIMTQYDRTVIVENKNDDLNIYEVAELLYSAVVATGFSEKLVNKIINKEK